MKPPRRGPFDEPPDTGWRRFVAPLSVLAGSSVTLFPVIAAFPVLPPLGLLMLLSWRLIRTEALPVWTPLALGLFDDLVSGQPLGSAMTLWSLCFFMIDLIDQRLVFRDFWQNWLIAGGAILFCLLSGRFFAAPLSAHVDSALIFQVVVSVMLFPVASLCCAWLDEEQEPA